ncbi:MAG TPA: universal stress protein [Mucilaginibacter sp.]|nr:universal stress protein [Mucilaginibacter sp.]
MKTIIAATDYKELSENAAEYAADIARLSKARLILLNDFTISIHAINARLPGPAIEELLSENELRLKKKAALLSEKFGIKVLPKATFSFVEDELKSLIDEYQANLVVLGMPSKTLEQDLLGNTTTSVIKNLRTPVLAVPAEAKFEGTKKVLFACDMLNGVSELLLSRIKNFALIIGAEVEVLLINETIEELKDKGADPLIYENVSHQLDGIDYYYKNLRSDSIIHSIEQEIKNFQADLLIMVPEKHGFWDSMIHRSKTRIMAAGLHIPLLSIPI